MDAHLLDARDGGRDAADCVRRRHERVTARPARVQSPRTDRLGRPRGDAVSCPRSIASGGYVIAGLPIVTAFPGWVYGNGSWFRERVIDPVMAGRRVVQFGKTGRWVSPIHVDDCARALVHLAEHGEAGGRYFLVNSDPIRMREFAGTFAHLANRPLRLWLMPAVSDPVRRRPAPRRGHPGRRASSRTSDYAESGSASNIPPSSRDSSTSSEHSHE